MLSNKERVKISKFLSLVLRHQPETAGLTLDRGGWVDVASLLAGCCKSGLPITAEQLSEVVTTNDKQRFEYSSDGTRIRASQGHSIEVNLGYTAVRPPELLYHGTAAGSIEAIQHQGLRRRHRHHVHLSADPQAAIKVGSRHGKPVVLTVLAGQMYADGFVFFLSTNGVWLTEQVPPQYLEDPEKEYELN